MSTATFQPLSIARVKEIGADSTFRNCVKAYLMARAYAEVERERVDAYLKPLFELYTFTVDPKHKRCGEPGEPITDMKDIWLATDEQCAVWYEECDKEHRKHGFKGPKNHCPAAIAEHLRIIAENNLLEYTMPLFVDGADGQVHGELRKKALDLFCGLAIQSAGPDYFRV